MIDYGTSCKSFNHEDLIFNTLVVRNGNLNYTLLNKEHLICNLICPYKETTFLVCHSLHREYKLLFGLHGELSEIINLVHFHFNES